MQKLPISITNILGQKCVKLLIGSKVYSLETIYAAGYVFLDKSYIVLNQEDDKYIEVFIVPKKKDSSREELKKLAFQFHEELTNYAHYLSRAKANKGVVEKILQRTLFSASPSLVEESEEREIQGLLNELETDDETKDLITDLKNEKNNSKKTK